MVNHTTKDVQQLRPVTPHTILSAKLLALKEQLQEANVSTEILQNMEESIQLIEPLDQYISEYSARPSKDLVQLEKETNQVDWDSVYENGQTQIRLEKEMVSGGVEGQFLNMLVAITNTKRILEVGSFTGYASLAMAEALPEDGKLIACEYDDFAATFAKKQCNSSPHGNKIEILIGEAIVSLHKLSTAGDSFDLVFIDADKENYFNYYTTILEKNLVKIGGLICVDNTLYMGQVYQENPASKNGQAIKKFNQSVREDTRVQQVILPLRDGVTLIRRVY